MRALSVILALSALLIISVWADNEKLVKAPNFTSDAVWIDTGASGKKPPHSIKGYRGQVLLIDFWEYICRKASFEYLPSTGLGYCVRFWAALVNKVQKCSSLTNALLLLSSRRGRAAEGRWRAP